MADNFATTQWTNVIAARASSVDARAALSDLSAAYYAPVLAFITADTAGRPFRNQSPEDLAQEFFARLLESGSIGDVQRGRGRFRSYLLGAVKHFLADARDYQNALKRGGDQQPEKLTESIPDETAFPPDATFDRAWALTIMARALECTAKDSPHFETLKPWLTGAAPSLDQSAAAAELGLSPGALKVAIHRLRKRFRAHLHQEVTETLDDPAELKHELNYLIEAASS